ncbi:hypothetical protein, partial [Streptomyces sp. FH025]|uniref:hypothetical protein n=1 Tax=Streptomyces sp. FH025 TaxID=2815937 RepID=UPI001A9DF33E
MGDDQLTDDQAVQGVLARLRQIFAEGDHLLKAPPGDWVFDADHLRFDQTLNGPRAEALYQFSLLANMIPEGSGDAWKHEGRLWDVYREILDAELADSGLSPDERKRYQEAHDELYTASKGRYVPSADLAAYRRMEAAWRQADREYRDAEAAARASEDPRALERWKEVDRPRLQAALDTAEDNWRTTGCKEKIERARRTLDELGSRLPSEIWKRYRATFDPARAEDWDTSPDGARYAATSFEPAAVVDSEWSSATVDDRQLPPAGAQAPTATDRTVEFEYTAVRLDRRWFDTPRELFTSRAWRLPPDTEPFSDGATPPGGRCPAYAESALFVRGIKLTESTFGRQDVLDLGTVPAEQGFWFSFETGEVCERERADAQVQATDIGHWTVLSRAPAALDTDPVDRRFEEITPADLRRREWFPGGSFGYSLDGSAPDPTDTVALRTRSGYYAKLQFLTADHRLNLRWAATVPAVRPHKDG